MSFEQKLLQIDELQTKIEQFGKLPEALLKKINYKFRLEWNYTSNSMEGNTLTKEETRSVMVGNVTVFTHALRCPTHLRCGTSIKKPYDLCAEPT